MSQPEASVIFIYITYKAKQLPEGDNKEDINCGAFQETEGAQHQAPTRLRKAQSTACQPVMPHSCGQPGTSTGTCRQSLEMTEKE